MFHILVLSHGGLAEELVNTSKLIMGEQEQVLSMGLDPSENLEAFKSRILEVVRQIQDAGVLVLTDLYGGTPTNAAILTLIESYPNVEIVTGCNLSMLLEAIIHKDTMELDESVQKLLEVGCQGIIRVKEALASLDE